MKALAEWSNTEIVNLIENYRRKNREGDEYFADLLEENSRRKGQGLNFQVTMQTVLAAGRSGKFVSYKQLADASGVVWSKVHYAMSDHLGKLIEYAHRRGWPLLSAVVVNQKNVATGAMDAATLTGFVTAARELGYVVTDEDAFLREQQQRVFQWAAEREDDPVGLTQVNAPEPAAG